ncbi:MAG: sulfotransferase [Cyanobacteria bacterium P01_G01_bin.49]
MKLPNFLIIGAPKAGTSSLYAYLNQHPEIYMSPIKEPHFFMLNDEKANFQGPGDQVRFKLSVHQLEEYKKLFEGSKNEIAIGEASTTYLGSNTAPERIKYYIPDVKLIAILRNPVDAAYASFMHLVRDGDESLKDFELALQAEEKRLKMNWDPLWHYTRRGFYYLQVNRYFETFNRDQIKIYIYEDFKKNPNFILKDIFQFLNVNENFLIDMSKKYNISGIPKSRVLNSILLKDNKFKSAAKLLFPRGVRKSASNQIKLWNMNNLRKPKMSEESRIYLTHLFREDLLRLQDLIQQDISVWLNDSIIN